tara:strand:- start:770 stop:1087 length:318 start_codon:yes stop_codon:yes gene_type:complete
MRSIIISVLFSLVLIIGCAKSKLEFQTYFDPEYKVIDRGALDVKVVSQACSETFEDALLAAKTNGKYHLRSVVGKKKHRIEFKEVGSYFKKDKICVEMRASSFPP